MSNRSWFIAAASAIGKSHIDTDKPNQDSFKYHASPDGSMYVAVVCDGAGSAKNAEKGSQYFSNEITHILMRLGQLLLKQNEVATLSKIKTFFIDKINEARNNLSSDANELRNKHSTAVAVLILPSLDIALSFQVGDSEILTSKFKLLTNNSVDYFDNLNLPHIGAGDAEYANETYFVTQTNWSKHLHISALNLADVDMIVLMTDGCCDLVLEGGASTKKIYRPFFSNLVFNLLVQSEADSRNSLIANALANKATYPVTGDDKTLVALLKESVFAYRHLEPGVDDSAKTSTISKPSIQYDKKSDIRLLFSDDTHLPTSFSSIEQNTTLETELTTDTDTNNQKNPITSLHPDDSDPSNDDNTINDNSYSDVLSSPIYDDSENFNRPSSKLNLLLILLFTIILVAGFWHKDKLSQLLTKADAVNDTSIDKQDVAEPNIKNNKTGTTTDDAITEAVTENGEETEGISITSDGISTEHNNTAIAIEENNTVDETEISPQTAPNASETVTENAFTEYTLDTLTEIEVPLTQPFDETSFDFYIEYPTTITIDDQKVNLTEAEVLEHTAQVVHRTKKMVIIADNLNCKTKNKRVSGIQTAEANQLADCQLDLFTYSNNEKPDNDTSKNDKAPKSIKLTQFNNLLSNKETKITIYVNSTPELKDAGASE